MEGYYPIPRGRALMTDLQKQIELLELQANEAELLSLLAHDPGMRARN